jgi:hypothetical protein
MSQTTQVEVWVLVDANGDYAVGRDAADAREDYDNDIGNDVDEMGGFRLVKVLLTVPLPVVVELSGTVPADGQAALRVA